MLRATAVLELGLFHSHRVVQTGPYKWTRHPAHAGMHLALVSVSFNWVSLLLSFVAPLPALDWGAASADGSCRVWLASGAIVCAAG
jgi:hypothetical protein